MRYIDHFVNGCGTESLARIAVLFRATRGANIGVKHVKMRSSVDVMAELESLRKKATQQSAPKPPRKEVSPLDALRYPKKREMQKSVMLPVAPGVFAKATSLRVAVSFENADGVVQAQEQTVELSDTADVKTLSVNLKFES